MQTSVTSSSVQDQFGAQLSSGTVCLVATDVNANPIPFQAGGTTYASGYKFCAAVSGGSLAALSVPTPATAVPSSIAYTVTIQQGPNIVVSCPLTPVSGSTFNLDTYVPSHCPRTFYANNYATGSTTGGITEAYSKCSSISTTGCTVVIAQDETISGNGSVTVNQGNPLFIAMNGHTIKLACASGVCLTFTANIAGASANLTLEHGQFLYTGSSGGSVTAGVELIGTDYAAIRDVTFGPQAGSTAIALWILLANADDNYFENDNFLNSVADIQLGTTGTGCATPGGPTTIASSSFHGNSGTLINLTGCTSNVYVLNSDLTFNTSQNAIDIDPVNGNASAISFEHNQIAQVGDGTSATKVVQINIPSTYGGTHIEFKSNTFFAYTNAVNGTVYAFTGAGLAGGLRLENNIYDGPYAHLQTGWTSGQGTIVKNEYATGWTPAPFGDSIENAIGFSSGGSGILQIGSVIPIPGSTNLPLGGSAANTVTIPRPSYNGGTGLSEGASCTSGPMAFSSGWNSPSSCLFSNNSVDSLGALNFTTGSSPTANPYVTFTFQDGTWGTNNNPFCWGSWQQQGSYSVQTVLGQSTPTETVFNYVGTPPAATQMALQYHCGL